MLKPIPDLPSHVAGLYAFGEVSETEYEDALIPVMDELLSRNNKINFVLILETNIKNFVSGAWCGNVKIGFKYFFNWGRVALVTDQKGLLGYSDMFKYILPGRFRYFPLDQLAEAIKWGSGK